MKTQQEPERGWAKATNSSQWHLFSSDSPESACGKFFRRGHTKLETNMESRPMDCAACRRTLLVDYRRNNS